MCPKLLYIACLFVITCLCCVSCHVVMTFPKARWPPLDFLDNYRSSGPCGVPRPKQPTYVDLYAGRTYNLTWALTFPHQGGYFIELLDAHYRHVQYLTKLGSTRPTFVGSGIDSSVLVTTPNRECNHCIIRLQRQALEWGSAYYFQTCADVNIVQTNTLDSISHCYNGNVATNDGRCFCSYEKRHFGSNCQYEADCEFDEHCGRFGRCVESRDQKVGPQRQCYCPWGHFGRHCEKKFQPTEDDECFNYGDSRLQTLKLDKYGIWNSECYTNANIEKKGKGHGDSLYWRLVNGGKSMEIIVDFNSTTWVSVGWKPVDLRLDCQQFPKLNTETASKPEPEPNTEPEPYSEPEGKPEPHGEPEPYARGEAEPEPHRSKRSSSSTHEMDCTDVIVAFVNSDNLQRIDDYYTRDRSTPLVDSYYGGTNNLEAAYATQKGDRLILMFRRAVERSEPSDHSLSGELELIWATGMTRGADGNYVHKQRSALFNRPDVDFYPASELKYHGSANRWHMAHQFVAKTAVAVHDSSVFWCLFGLLITAVYIVGFN